MGCLCCNNCTQRCAQQFQEWTHGATFKLHAMLRRVSGRLRTFALIVCAHLSCARNARRNHSRPQRPQSFWSAPGIETSGRCQDQTSVNHGLIVKSGKSDWLKIQSKYSAHAHKIGSGQRSGSLVLTKRIAASGDENARCHATSFIERAR